jgi:hypothetical protein
MIAKATYDPELEKQLSEERSLARDAKKKFRESITKVKTSLATMVESRKITPEGITYVKALIKETESWITSNPDATADEINDKSTDFMDKVVQLFDDDKGRMYHVYYISVWKALVTSWKATNMISEDQGKQIETTINEEELWYKKHLNETPDIYAERINDMVDKFRGILGPDFQTKIKDQMEKGPQSQNEVDALKAEAKQAKQDKETLEKKNFSVKRIAGKAGAGFAWAIFWSVLISFALFGASLASNMAIIRPTSIRILCWFYGLFFFIPVIFYAVVQYIMGNKPYFGAYLIPLYMYDPTTTEKKSFLEKLVWYQDNPILHQAQDTFKLASKAVIG